jgi:hypothetical protein
MDILHPDGTVESLVSSPEETETNRQFWAQVHTQAFQDAHLDSLRSLSTLAQPPDQIEATWLVERLVAMFLSPELREAVIGDLQERYGELIEESGYTRATLWFWRQIVTSLAPFAWVTLKRISGLEAIYRRMGR